MKKHLLLSLTIAGLIILGGVSCIKKEFANEPTPTGVTSQLRVVNQDTIRVIIYWGQSNCKGIISTNNVTYPDLLDTIPFSLVWNRTTNAVEKLHRFNCNGESNTPSFGAEMRMMKTLGERDNKYRCLLKWGAGGTQVSFIPGQDWNTASGTNEYFYKFKIHAYKLKKKLQDEGHVVIFEKMISYIGETDAIDSIYAVNYSMNLISINNTMKSYLGASAANMEFITVRIHDVKDHSDIVRGAQANIGTMVSTDEWKPAELHLGAGGYDSLGRKLASIIY